MLDLTVYDVGKEKRKLQECLQGKRKLVLGDANDVLERVMLTEALEEAGRKISPAARRLGISRSRLYRLLDKHGMLK